MLLPIVLAAIASSAGSILECRRSSASPRPAADAPAEAGAGARRGPGQAATEAEQRGRGSRHGDGTTPATREADLATTPRLPIDTPRISGPINAERRWRLDDVGLKQYRLTIDLDSPD